MWIALNYVSLKSWIQLDVMNQISVVSCELLWIMYLWKVEYNISICGNTFQGVVNCFELCIFEKLNTTICYGRNKNFTLWIALNYVSLKSWIQHSIWRICNTTSCELLWIMYLWKVEYNSTVGYIPITPVVNCFELCIFEKLNTTRHIIPTTFM